MSPPPPDPLPRLVLAAYGQPRGGGDRGHAGLDLRAAEGTPVLAAADGVVLRTGEHPVAGRFVVLAHADDLATVYWHLSAVAVRPGEAVRRGGFLGRAGRTGNATTPHLHFGVCRRPGGRCGPDGWDDPARYWVEGSPCFRPERLVALPPHRFTLPLPCP